MGDEKRFCVTFGGRSKLVSVKVPVGFENVKTKIRDKFGIEGHFIIQAKLEEFNRYIDVDDDDVEMLAEAKEILVLDREIDLSMLSPIPSTSSSSSSTSFASDSLCTSSPAPSTSSGSSSTRRSLISDPNTSRRPDQRGASDEKIFDVKRLMLKHPRGKPIDEEYNKNGTMTTQSRCELVQIVVANLVEKCSFYPDQSQKLAAAKAIIETYPNLKKKGAESGHESFFSSAGGKQSGYIQSKLKNIRRPLSDDAKQRPRKKQPGNEATKNLPAKEVTACGSSRKRPRAEDCISETAAEELALLAKRTSLDKVEEIKSAMKETFANRQKWLFEKGPCVGEIIEKYPRYKDVPQLVDYDFNYLFGEEKGRQLIKTWETRFVDVVLQLAALSKCSKVKELVEELHRPSDFEDDTEYEPSQGEKSMYAFLLLVNLLPTHATKKRGRVSSIQSMNFLLDFQPVGASVEHHLKTKEKERTQPYLLCIGTRDNPSQFFVIVDALAVPCPDDITWAVDRLFKVHYAFNLEYHPALYNFFTFLELVVYDMKSKKDRIPAIVLELESSLDALQQHSA